MDIIDGGFSGPPQGKPVSYQGDNAVSFLFKKTHIMGSIAEARGIEAENSPVSGVRVERAVPKFL